MTKMLSLDEFEDDITKINNFNFDEEEPEFSNISTSESKLYIWRIEKSKLIKWPEEKYGLFYDGDSFLILKIESETQINAHVWIGNLSTKDEISFVSCKVMQLDNKFKNKCNIFYEEQGKESSVFLSYFSVFSYVKGDCQSDLEAIKSKKSIMRLFHIYGDGINLKVTQIPINKKYISSKDTFLLDTGINIYIFIGKESSGFEKFKLASLLKKIQEFRSDKVNVIEINENSVIDGDIKNRKIFDEMLEKFEEKEEIKKETKLNEPKKMFKISDAKGKVELSEVKFGKESLNSDDVFLIDAGESIILFIGKNASKYEKRMSRYYAKKYLSTQKNNAKLPTVVVNEGNIAKDFDKYFE